MKIKYLFSCIAIFCLSYVQIIAKTGELTEGKEFIFGIPPVFLEKGEAERGEPVTLYVSSKTATLVTVEGPGLGFKVSKTLSANKVVSIAIPAEFTNHPNLKSKLLGLRVTAPNPISVTVAISYRWTGEMFRVYPTYALGKRYFTLNQYQDKTDVMKPAMILVSANYDNTTISYTPTANVQDGVRAGKTATTVLNKGETFLILAETQEAITHTGGDLTGTYIQSDKPIGVVSGHTKVAFPHYGATSLGRPANFMRNAMIEMMPPVEMLGTEYVSIPFQYLSRTKGLDQNDAGDLIRFVATEDKTQIYTMNKDGVGLKPISPLLSKSQHFDIVNQEVAAYYSSNKPVLVGQYGKSWRDHVVNSIKDGENPQNPSRTGTGMLIVLPPIHRWASSTIFRSPEFTDDFITIVFETKNQELMKFDGKPFNSVFAATVKTITGTPFSYISQQISVGDHSVSGGRAAVNAHGSYDYSKDGFAWGIAASINFAAMGPIRDTLAPKVTLTMNCDGSIQDGIIEDLPYDSTVRSNILMIMEEPDSLNTNYFDIEYNSVTLESRPSVINWKLMVSNPFQKAHKTFRVVDAAGNDTVIMIEYRGHNILEMSPPLLDFGKIKLGQVVSRKVLITNNSANTYDITRLLTRYNNGFRFTNVKAHNILLPQQSIEFEIEFQGKRGNLHIDSAGIGDSCLVYFKTQLRADVIVPVILALDIDFGQLKTPSKTKDVVIRNIGSDDLQITGYSIPQDTVFKQINWPLVSDQNPLIIKPSETLQLPIMFTPDRQGEWHNRITFQSDGDGYKNYVDLSGSAVITAVENDNLSYGFNITPNPVFGNFTITYPKPVDIIIRDMLGRSVFRTTFEGSLIIPTNDFSTGIHFVEILERNGTQRFEKIVVQK